MRKQKLCPSLTLIGLLVTVVRVGSRGNEKGQNRLSQQYDLLPAFVWGTEVESF